MDAAVQEHSATQTALASEIEGVAVEHKEVLNCAGEARKLGIIKVPTVLIYVDGIVRAQATHPITLHTLQTAVAKARRDAQEAANGH